MVSNAHGRGGVIWVYTNCDVNLKSTRFLVNARTSATLSQVINSLTEKLEVVGGVHRLYSLYTGERVDDVNQLYDAKCIVAAGKEKLNRGLMRRMLEKELKARPVSKSKVQLRRKKKPHHNPAEKKKYKKPSQFQDQFKQKLEYIHTHEPQDPMHLIHHQTTDVKPVDEDDSDELEEASTQEPSFVGNPHPVLPEVSNKASLLEDNQHKMRKRRLSTRELVEIHKVPEDVLTSRVDMLISQADAMNQKTKLEQRRQQAAVRARVNKKFHHGDKIMLQMEKAHNAREFGILSERDRQQENFRKRMQMKHSLRMEDTSKGIKDTIIVTKDDEEQVEKDALEPKVIEDGDEDDTIVLPDSPIPLVGGFIPFIKELSTFSHLHEPPSEEETTTTSLMLHPVHASPLVSEGSSKRKNGIVKKSTPLTQQGGKVSGIPRVIVHQHQSEQQVGEQSAISIPKFHESTQSPTETTKAPNETTTTTIEIRDELDKKKKKRKKKKRKKKEKLNAKEGSNDDEKNNSIDEEKESSKHHHHHHHKHRPIQGDETIEGSPSINIEQQWEDHVAEDLIDLKVLNVSPHPPQSSSPKFIRRSLPATPPNFMPEVNGGNKYSPIATIGTVDVVGPKTTLEGKQPRRMVSMSNRVEVVHFNHDSDLSDDRKEVVEHKHDSNEEIIDRSKLELAHNDEDATLQAQQQNQQQKQEKPYIDYMNLRNIATPDLTVSLSMLNLYKVIAATKIQAVYRGYSTRKRLGKNGSSNSSSNSNSSSSTIKMAYKRGKRPQSMIVSDHGLVDDTFVYKHYRLLEKLGDGNFADVRRCKSIKDDQEYAMKIVYKDRLKDKREKMMIATEVEIMREVDHPQIIKFYEVFETSDKICLLLELVRGGDLFDRIVERGHFTEKDAKGIVGDLGSAVAYLHERNIVHRDLKPENILVANGPMGTDLVKLGDFGLSMHVTEKIYTICGTPTYVAPEIISKDAVGYGLEVDLWALGIISYILLCGFPPFSSPSKDQQDLFDRIRRGAFTFPKKYWETVSDQAKELIKGLLRVNPKKRITAKMLVEHRWLTRVGSAYEELDLSKTITKGILENFPTKQRWSSVKMNGMPYFDNTTDTSGKGNGGAKFSLLADNNLDSQFNSLSPSTSVISQGEVEQEETKKVRLSHMNEYDHQPHSQPELTIVATEAVRGSREATLTVT
eukprot:m.74749 g.74749  ORF g.74749 m.74749 type:complete len:1183 (-) comp8459_c0_seq2:144-3692(-)